MADRVRGIAKQPQTVQRAQLAGSGYFQAALRKWPVPAGWPTALAKFTELRKGLLRIWPLAEGRPKVAEPPKGVEGKSNEQAPGSAEGAGAALLLGLVVFDRKNAMPKRRQR